jgi:cytochrome c oxidase cbb3-type subunit 3
MKIPQPLQIGAMILILSAIAYRLAHAHQVPASQSQAGTQPTYFVEHPDHIQPGLTFHGRWAAIANPYANDQQRIDEGGKLFVAYNCMDCHGADGSGAMGPSLQDSRWHFGATDADVFQSIYEGRPDGMPSWGGRIADDQIWRLVAYVQSLSRGHDVTTENFTGKTIARTGH